VGLETGARIKLGQVLEQLSNAPSEEKRLRGEITGLIAALRHDYEVVDLADQSPRLVSNIAAPVFGPQGDVVVCLTLNAFRAAMTGEEIDAAADHLMSVTRLITKATGGHAPVEE
jgi:DNA-binding IclR family transcriptional regulator